MFVYVIDGEDVNVFCFIFCLSTVTSTYYIGEDIPHLSMAPFGEGMTEKMCI